MKLGKQEIVNKYLFQIIIILICTIPVVITCLYIMPAADDFSNSINMKILLEEYGNPVTAAFKGAGSLYWTTGGYYFAVFLNLLFSPFLYWGVTGVRVFCIIINVLLYIVLYLFVRLMMTWCLKSTNNKNILNVYAIVLFCFTNIYLNVEASFWYCVSVAYVLVFVIMLLGVLAFCKSLQQKKITWGIVAAIIGFLVSGSSLNITAVNCFLYLLIAIFGICFLKEKRITILCFCTALAGALINVASPANYTRHESISGEYNVISAFVLSLKLVVNRIYESFSNTVLPFILVGLFLYILFSSIKWKRVFKIHPIILCGLLGMSLVVFAFPVYLGYVDVFPQRCMFVQDSIMYLYLIFYVIYAACYIKERYGFFQIQKEQIWYTIGLFFLIFCIYHSNIVLSEEYPSIYLTKQIIVGEDAEFRDYWTDILNEIENSKEKKVTINRNSYTNTAPLISPKLGDPAYKWVEKSVASYYGKEKVEVIIH